MTDTLPSACPDLIVLYPAAGYLSVFAYRIGLRSNSLIWRERVKCSAGAELAAELPPLLARHPLRLETTAALVADPGIGGVLLLPEYGNAHRDRIWLERRLELALPYPPRELQWRTVAKGGKVEVFWVPRAWVKTQTETLSRLGLRLDEVYPRASLWREEARKSLGQQPSLLQDNDSMHVFDNGLVQRSTPLPAEAEAAARAQQLERLAMGTDVASVARRVPAESEEALGGRILALWHDGSDAIHLSVGRWAVWRPALTLAAACAVLVAGAAIALLSLNGEMESSLEGLTREQRKLASVEQKFIEMERSLRNDRRYVEAAKGLDKSALPLEALTQISAALPDKYWVQHMLFTGNTLELAGRGGSSEAVVRLLGTKGIEATAVVPANDATVADKARQDAYSIRLDLSKLPAGVGR